MRLRKLVTLAAALVAAAGCSRLVPGRAEPKRVVWTVSGARLLRNGVPDTVHGVNRPSCEWNPECVRVSREDFQRMRDWGARAVRIPLDQDFMLPGAARYRADYRERIRAIVRTTADVGFDAVILDLHWSDRGDLANPRPAQQRMADSNSLAFWRMVADDFKGDGRVMFELYNEPHDVSWDVWLDGGALPEVRHRDGTVDPAFVAVGMQQMYDAVRSTGARNVVVAGGLDWAYDLSGVPTHRLRGYNVAYATHPYPFESKLPATWDRSFGDLSATDLVIATEFGDNRAQCTPEYSAQFVDYARRHGLSWTAWAWFAPGDAPSEERLCRFPSVIARWDGTPTPQGAVVKAALGGR